MSSKSSVDEKLQKYILLSKTQVLSDNKLTYHMVHGYLVVYFWQLVVEMKIVDKELY